MCLCNVMIVSEFVKTGTTLCPDSTRSFATLCACSYIWDECSYFFAAAAIASLLMISEVDDTSHS